MSVIQVATQIGFYDQNHFHRHFKKASGING
ncbi:MAG: AraC family transcriptional regulator [Colwellia sp.]|nr:AraC family transcriptional regulator [Colwellia sp.]